MKVSKPMMWLIVVIVAIGAVIAFQGYKNSLPGPYDDFASCVTESGAKMFGAFWCSACKVQKAEFGKSFKKIEYIECSKGNREQTRFCNEEGIESYPTWEFSDGEKITGVHSFYDLSDKTGCVVPEDY